MKFQSKSTNPIFIVGAPRSGTTLLTSFVASHKNIYSGAETQFFNKIGLGSAELKRALKEDEWPDKAIALMQKKLTLSGQSVLELYGKSTQDLHDFLSERSPSVGAMLESIVSQKGNGNSERRWLEKTPNHLQYVSEILNYFPDAKVILIHRDLRASASSIPKLPWASNSILENAALISSWFEKVDEYKEIDRVLFVSYEMLVRDCDNELKKVFDFIHERFDSRVINRESADDITTNNEPWKEDIRGSITTSNIGKWKTSLSQELITQLEAVCGKILQKLGYELTTSNKFEPLQLKKLRGQKLNGIDCFIEQLTSNKKTITYSESESILILAERNFVLKALLCAIKSKVIERKKVYFIGLKTFPLNFFGKYI